MYELTVTVVECTKPTQAQTRLYPRVESGGEPKALSVALELLVVDSCWKYRKGQEEGVNSGSQPY